MMKNKKIIAVNVAIINQQNKVLIAKRPADKPMPNKWEFPGGKIEHGETPEECLTRELKEEFDIDVTIGEGYFGMGLTTGFPF